MEAKKENKAIKTALVAAQAAGQLVEQPSQAPERGGQRCFDLAGLADTHYAIAERKVEASRQEYKAAGKGNWINDKHNSFCNQIWKGHATLL